MKTKWKSIQYWGLSLIFSILSGNFFGQEKWKYNYGGFSVHISNSNWNYDSIVILIHFVNYNWNKIDIIINGWWKMLTLCVRMSNFLFSPRHTFDALKCNNFVDMGSIAIKFSYAVAKKCTIILRPYLYICGIHGRIQNGFR